MVSTLTDSVCVPALVAIVVEAILAPHLYLPLKLDLLPGAETALVIITCKGWCSGFCSSREEFVDVDPEADVNLIGEDSLDEDSNRTLHSIMKTFSLTWKEALEEFISYTYQAGDVEAGSIWL